MKKIPLIISLIVNVLFVITIFGIRFHYHEIIFRSLSNLTTSEVSFHERLLTELQSEDEYKINIVTAMLKKNIQDGKEFAAIWEAAAERSRLK